MKRFKRLSNEDADYVFVNGGRNGVSIKFHDGFENAELYFLKSDARFLTVLHEAIGDALAHLNSLEDLDPDA
jgi:hypothetical protein